MDEGKLPQVYEYPGGHNQTRWASKTPSSVAVHLNLNSNKGRYNYYLLLIQILCTCRYDTPDCRSQGFVTARIRAQ
jgi:hypothetical protein